MNNYYKRIFNWTLFIVCSFIISCSPARHESDKVFIISSLAKSNNSHFAKQPEGFYKEFNFIIDSSGSTYYYYLKQGEWSYICDKTLPVFTNLQTEQMIQVSHNNIIDFFKCNVLRNHNHITVSIASQKDTINSPGFTFLYNYLTDSTKDIDYWIRSTTNEENIVMYYKKNRLYYNPELIDWDSTKTVFIKPPIEVDERKMLQLVRTKRKLTSLESLKAGQMKKNIFSFSHMLLLSPTKNYCEYPDSPIST
jgi:hypothetical protein